MRVWKTAGVLVKPNGITRYSKCPKGVLKASSTHPEISDTHQMVGVP